jgi:hypothetical protein
MGLNASSPWTKTSISLVLEHIVWFNFCNAASELRFNNLLLYYKRACTATFDVFNQSVADCSTFCSGMRHTGRSYFIAHICW